METYSKGQVQAVTVVLLTGLTIGVASVVYVWGQPILDKRDSEVQLDSVEQKILDLRQEIIRVSEGGEGAASEISMDFEEDDYEVRMIQVNESNDYIDIIVDADESPYPDGRWTMLKGDTMQNLSITSGDYAIKGEDLGSVLMVRPQSSIIRYRIEFRNLYSQTSGTSLEKVDLQNVGGGISSGETDIYVRNSGSQLDSGQDGLTISTGQTLDRRRTQIEVDLR